MSFDIDVFDFILVLVIGIFVVGGLIYWEGMYIVEEIYNIGLLLVLDFVEVNF